MEVISEERAERYRRVLGLGPVAGVDDVRRCYRREMRRWHPDVPGGSEERSKELNEAKDYLSKHPDRITAMRVVDQRPRTQRPPQRTPAQPRTQSSRTYAKSTPPAPEPPTWTPPTYPWEAYAPTAAPAPVPAESQPVAVPAPDSLGERIVGGGLRVIRFLVIAYLALLAFAVLGWVVSTLLSLILR